jgi:hypothetical protein
VKDRKACNDVVQKTSKPLEVVVEDEEEEGEEEENNSIWFYYALSYFLYTFKCNIIYEYVYTIIYVTNTG